MTYEIFDYFFVGEWEAPEEYLWSAYGPGHIIWLVSMGLIIFFACKFFRRADNSRQERILKALAVWILIQEIIKDLLYYYSGNLGVEHLPLHICGISIFFTLWYAFSPNRLNGAYIYAMSMPGAMAALIFPNWTGFPLFHFSSINSFSIHGELVLFALLALTSRRLRPDIRMVLPLFAIIVAMGTPIHYLNKLWGTNFMFISYPSPGSPLIPLYNVFGDYYVAVAAVLLLFGWVIMFLPWWKSQKLR